MAEPTTATTNSFLGIQGVRIVRHALLAALLVGLAAGGCVKRPAIPDGETAITAACKRIHADYHSIAVCSLSNFRAALDGDVWTVSQVLPSGDLEGGVFVQLSKSDGHVIRTYLIQ
jgi:hypothetical protein